MLKYLKYLVPKPIYIWYQRKYNHLYLCTHNPYGSQWFQYLDEKSYIWSFSDKNSQSQLAIDTKTYDGTIGDLVKSGSVKGPRRRFKESLKYNTALTLRERVHGRETIEPE